MSLAVITGVSSGIGFATAKIFLERGFRVFGSIRTEEDADRLRRVLGPGFTPLLFDVTDHQAIDEAAAEVGRTIGKVGGISVLVNNAGIAINGPLEHLPIEQVRQQFEVNITGLIKVTQAFLPLIKPGEGWQGGRIINIGSISGIIASPFTGIYAASKHALEGLSDALRRELLIYNIPVVLLQPGPIKTEIWRKAKESENPWTATDYGPIFKNRDRVISQTEDSALPVDRVSEAVYKAAVSPKPRHRYLIDRNPWRIRLAKMMPSSWLDNMVKKNFRKHLEGASSAWRGWCILLFLSSLFLLPNSLSGQSLFSPSGFFDHIPFQRCDTVRGMLLPNRDCYDVNFYHLNLRINPTEKSIAGYVDMHFRVVSDFERVQIDLFRNMTVDSISIGHERNAGWTRDCDALLVETGSFRQGEEGMIRIHYHGMPVTAPMPPWDGGFVWATDDEGYPWVGVACEGEGASLWWPNKDHLSDEPDSLSMRIEVPVSLSCVANGNLRDVEPTEPGWHAFNWFVSYPINNYNVTVNIGRYAHFTDTYVSFDNDTLQCDYYVLSNNLEKAQKHFKQVGPMLSCFETYFGKYPFWDDGFALVETPYLGMEHQSAIAYGNKFQRGYLGGMIPEDMDWDYIIIHETGHEYWGNSISCNDLSEMWIHESFTTYMEALYVECRYSYEDAVRYLLSQRSYIRNAEPIIGPADVNWHQWKSSDHYYKGAWVLHTLRHAIGNDGFWFRILMEFYQTHAISQVTTREFVEFVNLRTGNDWTGFFRQYLLYPGIPRLAYEISEVPDGITVTCRWETDVDSFTMPVLAGKSGMMQRIEPSSELQTFFFANLKPKDFQVATDLFYITTRAIEE